MTSHGGKRTGAGRKPRGEASDVNLRVTVRLTRVERAKLQAAAWAAGEDLSEAIRRLALR